MAIEECPHCIQKVLFSDDGQCPSCGNNKYISPKQSRDQIICDKEKKELIEQIIYSKRKSISILIGSGLLFLGSISISVWTTLNSKIIIWWYGGVVAGFMGIVAGFKLIKIRKGLKKLLVEKFK